MRGKRAVYQPGEIVRFQREPGGPWELGEYLRYERGWHVVCECESGRHIPHHVPSRRVVPRSRRLHLTLREFEQVRDHMTAGEFPEAVLLAIGKVLGKGVERIARLGPFAFEIIPEDAALSDRWEAPYHF